MGLFWKNTSVVGLDIGSSTVKLVELEKDKKEDVWHMLNFESVTLPPEAIVGGEIIMTQKVVEAIKRLFDKCKPKTKEVCTAIAGSSIMIKRINLPEMTAEELEESIHWEAEQYIHFDIQEVNLDLQILSEGDDSTGQMEVLLVAAMKDVVSEYAALIREAGLSPAIIDVASLALCNMFELNYGVVPEPVALVNVGDSMMSIAVVQNGNPTYARDIPSLGGRKFTEEIQRALNISFEEAEGMKVGGDAKDAAAVVPEEIEMVLRDVSDSIASEVQTTLDFHFSTVSEPLSKIYLAGGAARTPGLLRAIAERTSTPVEIIDSFQGLDLGEREFNPSYLDDVSPQAAVAVGLALRAIGDK